MEEFFIKLIDAIPTAIVTLALGSLGLMFKSYYGEKGKNLATKEDIQEITHKIEFIKNEFSKKHLKSKAYIEKQILAYDKIIQLISLLSGLDYL